MMSELLTIDDLLERVEQTELAQVAGIGSHNAPEGRSLDTAKIEAAIKFAGDMVRGYLFKRYPIINDLDATQTPDLIKGYMADIVRHRLRDRADSRNTTSQEIKDRLKGAQNWLRDVSRGLINVDLSGVAGGDVAAQAGAVNPGGKIHAHSEPVRAPSILDGYL